MGNKSFNIDKEETKDSQLPKTITLNIPPLSLPKYGHKNPISSGKGPKITILPSHLNKISKENDEEIPVNSNIDVSLLENIPFSPESHKINIELPPIAENQPTNSKTNNFSDLNIQNKI